MKPLPYCHIRKFLLIFFYLLVSFISSCKKFIEIDVPDNQLASQTVFTTDATAIAAISGIYSNMVGGSGGFASGGIYSVNHFAGLSADEFTNYLAAPDILGFYLNEMEPANPDLLANLWGEPYRFIYGANSILEGLTRSGGVNINVKNHVEGEAKFIRAFCYFYLVNLFGDVPLITSTDYTINSRLSRNPRIEIYQQIVLDLQDAQSELEDEYVTGSERVRPNKSAATALLARAYLFMGDYTNAELQATAVINDSSYYKLEAIENTFLSTSSEAIWQLKPVQPEINTQEGNFFILTDVPSYVSLSDLLYNSFEPNDERKLSWTHDTTILNTSYHYPFKYKLKAGSILSEYSIVLRLSEQYLIRSEARAWLNNVSGAQTDLNLIRNRAGLSNTTASSKTDLLDAILHERQVELFAEWGHRWLDLKRTGAIDSVMNKVTALKGGSWNSSQQLYPVPQLERDKNPALSQNTGY